MEVIILCVTITMIIAVALVGMGVCFGRGNKGQCNVNSNGDAGVDGRGRDRRGNNGYDQSLEIDDITNVLQNISLSCTGYERRCVDAAVEIINKVQDMLKES